VLTAHRQYDTTSVEPGRYRPWPSDELQGADLAAGETAHLHVSGQGDLPSRWQCFRR
jgi:hypothetical protein